MPKARTISELQADILAAYQSHDDARAVTHALRVKASEAQTKETAAADAVVAAEKLLASAIESNPPETL